MAVNFTVDKKVDCTGSFCPVPVIRARQAVNAMAPGQVLEIVATDPGSKGDFRAFAKNTGHELIHALEEGKVFTYYIRVSG